MKRLAVLASVVGLGALLGGAQACGGDSKDAAKDFDTGLPPDKALSSLTPAEIEQACERLQSRANALLPQEKLTDGLCTLAVVGFANTEGVCEGLRDACVSMVNEDPELMGGLTMGDCSNQDGNEFEDCDATVAELEGCSNDFLNGIDEQLTRYTCEDAAAVSSDEASLEDFGAELPASCQRVEERCPGATSVSEMLPQPR